MVSPTLFNGFSGPAGQSTEAEWRLIEATALGTEAECQDLSTEARLVAPELIAAVATGEFRHADWPDWQPSRRGVHLVGARIATPLSLGRQQILGDLAFAYSLDTFVPFLDLGSEGYWRANTLAYAGGWPVGWILYILVVIERFLEAILLAIAVTGFTGLLTRDER